MKNNSDLNKKHYISLLLKEILESITLWDFFISFNWCWSGDLNPSLIRAGTIEHSSILFLRRIIEG